MTVRKHIKICGITRSEDALFAAQLGAWAVGFIFVKNTPRYIEPQEALKIIKLLPENIKKIGVFADSSIEDIANVAIEAGITGIQLHGSETPEFCEKLSEKIKLPIIKAIRVKDYNDLSIIPEYKNKIFAVLLDTYSDSQIGGTGEIFDWNIAVEAKSYDIPVIVAGGLNPDNIKEACQKIQPYALDVSSGVEKTKGIKDHSKLKKLFSAITC